MLSKLAGLALIFSVSLPVGRDASSCIWAVFILLLVLAIDLFMGHFISKPVSKLNAAAKRMAGLDFFAPCTVSTTDEFGELAETVAGRLLVDTPDADFELQYELPEQKVFVEADQRRMEQVLGNLIVNAKKNVHHGGVLRLELTEGSGMLHFSVFNQGKAIPKDVLPKIWTKFYRDSNAQYSDSGLGLSIAAQILSMQNLPCGAENLADGVRFYFSIPIVP